MGLFQWHAPLFVVVHCSVLEAGEPANGVRNESIEQSIQSIRQFNHPASVERKPQTQLEIG